jgi:hypothetical protein
MNAIKQMPLFRFLVPTLLVTAFMTGAAPALADTSGLQFGAGVVIPIVAILMVFGAPAVTVILIVYFVFRHRERRQQLLNERIQRFLDAGQQLPESLMQATFEQPTTPIQHLQHGILLLSLGIGLTVFLTLFESIAVGSLGLVFAGLGVAKIIIWRFASRQD